jgi:hypothetical protein
LKFIVDPRTKASCDCYLCRHTDNGIKYEREQTGNDGRKLRKINSSRVSRAARLSLHDYLYAIFLVMDSEQNALLETAQLLSQQLDTQIAQLILPKEKDEYLSQDFTGLPDSAIYFNPGDPTLVEQDLKSQLSDVKKLKFNFLEQNTKGRYIRTIISDIDPGISQETYEELSALNQAEKEKLKEAKARLAETNRQLVDAAPLIAAEMKQLKQKQEEMNRLAAEIVDARLAISRLRARHPHPRLTVAKASSIADEQIMKMQAIEDEMQEIDTKITETREKAKTASRELEKMKVERGELERKYDEVKSSEEGEDARVLELYEWFTTALALYRKLLYIHSIDSPTANSIHITYSRPERVTVVLVFAPGTRKLVNASLLSPPSQFSSLDIEPLLSTHTPSGDVKAFLSDLSAVLHAQAV